MKTFSALLAICAGNSPVTGEFPTQRPVTESFVFFFDLCLNKRLSKQWRGWWFETPLRPLWRHCNDCNSEVAFRFCPGCVAGRHYQSERQMNAMASRITGQSSVCSAVWLDRQQRSIKGSSYCPFVRGIHRWPVDYRWTINDRSIDDRSIYMTDRPATDKSYMIDQLEINQQMAWINYRSTEKQFINCQTMIDRWSSTQEYCLRSWK